MPPKKLELGYREHPLQIDYSLRAEEKIEKVKHIVEVYKE